ncbi:MAG: hypothetical protein KKF56_05315 [Nanoarchaeota archaeon]|nr:hypothetical protein [Nanoarchaeota archaeon]
MLIQIKPEEIKTSLKEFMGKMRLATLRGWDFWLSGRGDGQIIINLEIKNERVNHKRNKRY